MRSSRMISTKRTRWSVLAAGAAATAMVLSACGGGGDISGGGSSGEASGDTDCSAFEEYGHFDGESVSLFSSIREVEADQLQQTFDKFTECTGIEVQHNGVGEFESQVVVQVEGGNAPDLAIFPQPGLLQRMVKDGHVITAPAEVEKNVDEGWSEDWKAYGTVDGKFYAAPLMASVKSFVWYSPSMFKEGGYEVPQTWQELLDLTEKIAKDHEGEDVKPWCAGIESGGATGWPATDWVEDLVLRSAGADVYDQWVTHDIAFNDPAIEKATEEVGKILRDDRYVNGGIGDARSIATTSFNDGGLPILEGQCYMYRMASFYEAQWPEGTDVSENGDVFAFYLPGMTADEKPLLTAGEFVGAFNDRDATKAVQAYMSSGLWANTRVEIGGVTSANKGVDPELASSDILRLAMELLQDKDAVARFDGSDLMPSEVGAGSFWTAMTQWLNGEKDVPTVLGEIEASWPAK